MFRSCSGGVSVVVWSENKTVSYEYLFLTNFDKIFEDFGQKIEILAKTSEKKQAKIFLKI